MARSKMFTGGSAGNPLLGKFELPSIHQRLQKPLSVDFPGADGHDRSRLERGDSRAHFRGQGSEKGGLVRSTATFKSEEEKEWLVEELQASFDRMDIIMTLEKWAIAVHFFILVFNFSSLLVKSCT